MKAHPIIFNKPMLLALLDGSKTQTRRVMKPQPDLRAGTDMGELPENGGWKCPYGQPGDLLYVRERLQRHRIGSSDAIDYYVDGRSILLAEWTWQRDLLPSIFMPRWASRLTLKVTDVRVERVQDITESDAIAEGIKIDDVAWTDPRAAYKRLWDSISNNWGDNPWVWVVEFEVIRNNIDEVLGT